MSREVIQDFLNLTGVVGIALANRRMRPYFYGFDSVMERTKEVLGQGILQVMENVPDGFESFEFHFAKSLVFVYKLSHGLVLLVMADRHLNLVEYRHGIKGIKHLVETDTYNTVATFKLLLGSMTQHSLPSIDSTGANIFASNGSKSAASNPADLQARRTDSSQSRSNSYQNIQTNNAQGGISGNQPKPSASGGNQVVPQSSIPQRSPQRTTSTQTNSNQNTVAQSTAQNTQTSAAYQRVPAASERPPVPVAPAVPVAHASTVALGEIIQAMNQLSQFTTQYLGKVVVANYWKSTRPDHEWLSKIEVDRNAALYHPQQGVVQCNPQQQELIHQWLMAYIKRCKQVIRNFDTMICQDCLNEAQQKLLML